MTGVIYALHFGGKKRYIGSTGRIKNRIAGHWSLLTKGKHHSIALQRAVNKYGLENLLIEIMVDNVPLDQLLVEEQRLLDQYQGFTYNCSPTATSRRGCKERPETKAKRVASLMGNKRRLGILHTSATKKAISLKLKLQYADGVRQPTGIKNLNRYWDSVYSGLVVHPTIRPIGRVIEILSDLAVTKSARRTGERLGMDQENVRAVLKQATSTLESIAGPGRQRKHERGFFIHPDWFDLLQEIA